MTRLVYRALLRLAFPAVVLHAAAVALRDRSARYLLQRFGLRLPAPAAPPLWIHCASVGELNPALILAAAWRKARPGDAILLTSATVSAHRLFRRKAGADMRHCYLPLDYPLLCRRFLKVVRPRCALMMEAEIWLNLFGECGARGVPVIIVNGRLSAKTMKPARRFGGYYRQSLSSVRAVLARSQTDRERFVALGMAPADAEVAGNLKYSAEMPAQTPDRIGRRYCLAASTHDGEETQIARAWPRAATGLALVVAPRHPQRCAAAARQLRRAGFDVAVHGGDGGAVANSGGSDGSNNGGGGGGRSSDSRSSGSGGGANNAGTNNDDGNGNSGAGANNAEVILFCEVGHLQALIRHAACVFLGGSLVAKGGHNLLEAARLGTPQATGPHLDNFAQEARALQQAGGLLIANNEDELAAFFTRAAGGGCRAQADNAAAFMRAHDDVAAHYVKRLQELGL